MRDLTITYRNNPSVLFDEGVNQIRHRPAHDRHEETPAQLGPRMARRWPGCARMTDHHDEYREYSCTMDGADTALESKWTPNTPVARAPRTESG